MSFIGIFHFFKITYFQKVNPATLAMAKLSAGHSGTGTRNSPARQKINKIQKCENTVEIRGTILEKIGLNGV